jgi:hypothetical protein
MSNWVNARIFEFLGLDNIHNTYQLLDEPILYNTDRLDIVKQNYFDNKKPQLVLADSNPVSVSTLKKFLSQTREAGVPVKILTGNLLDVFNGNPDLVYYPMFYVRQQHESDFQPVDKKFRFSFLSGQARFHRLYLYQQCKQHITDQDCFAVNTNNVNDQENFIKTEMLKMLRHAVDLTADTPFISSMAAADEYTKIFKSQPNSADYTNQHPAYSAMFNITGESNTHPDQVFLSEKTWKAIRSRCLTMSLGNNGTVDCLQRLGFELPREVDPELSLLEKIQFIVHRMQSWDIEKCSIIYKKHINTINHNVDRFAGPELKTFFTNQIKEKLAIS